jgi:hypothetical protein
MLQGRGLADQTTAICKLCGTLSVSKWKIEHPLTTRPSPIGPIKLQDSQRPETSQKLVPQKKWNMIISVAYIYTCMRIKYMTNICTYVIHYTSPSLPFAPGPTSLFGSLGITFFHSRCKNLHIRPPGDGVQMRPNRPPVTHQSVMARNT